MGKHHYTIKEINDRKTEVSQSLGEINTIDVISPLKVPLDELSNAMNNMPEITETIATDIEAIDKYIIAINNGINQLKAQANETLSYSINDDQSYI